MKIICQCGKCSILGYIKGKDECSGSRPPQIKRWTPDPPYPKNRVSMTEISCKMFKTALGVETQHMHDAFCILLDDTFKMLENEANLDFFEVKQFTRSLLSPALKGKYHKPIHKKCPTVGCLEKITQYKKLREFLEDNYCSWFNYKIIEVFRKRYLFGRETKDTGLLEYQNTFSNYIKRRCFLYVDDFGPRPHDVGMVQVLCKVDIDFEVITDHQIELVKLSFVNCLNYVLLESYSLQLTEYNVTLERVDNGCTELIFRAPAYLESFTDLTLPQACCLKGKGFIDITVGGKSLLSKVNLYVEYNCSKSTCSVHIYVHTCMMNILNLKQLTLVI